jgi:hypothetical protein
MRSKALVAAVSFFAAVTAYSGVSKAVILDGGFESPPVSSFTPSDGTYYVPPNYAYVPPLAAPTPTVAGAWTYNAGAGLINGDNPGAFDGASGYVGHQFAFIQGQDSYISQDFSATPGIGRIDWLQAGRPFHGCCNGDQILRVILNGVTLGDFASTSGQPFTAESIIGVTLATNNTLQFLGLVNADDTAFIDEVSVTNTPLPATWTMMLIGFFGLGLFAFRGMKNRPVAFAAA